ncbi:preprotein translocase subunit SecE [Arthrobacter roseus]|uniref:preprotein translocase subunit SecE n=1 Tax=Arthrobacter roseus TaxID=136274 RepID=UPI0019659F18|nr:preprotein translocase subunit SecE [Arthrobacter roseus]MBM7849348.1 preprotein translocase subunit SecE [Arthrobacter roseus]
MIEVMVTETAAGSSKGSTSGKDGKPGFVGGIVLFVRQVIAELKKVVTPTRQELLRYTIVVMIFVLIMMAIVSILDFAFGLGAQWVFGSGSAGS